MNAKTLLLCLALGSTSILLIYSHMVIEERMGTNGSSFGSLQENMQSEAPPILIVALPTTVKKAKKLDKKPKKNKLSTHSKRPPPPANCVPLWGSCKMPSSVCCDHCAFCQCRLFKTVCYCRMGNPRC